MIKIYAYNRYSQSARRLADEMDVYLIRHTNSRYRPRPGDTVINWGRGRNWTPARTLNPPDRVQMVVNKLSFFRCIHAWNEDTDHDNLEQINPTVRIPDWTTDITIAREWARAGRRVVVRRLLEAHEGRGIEIHTEADEIPQAPLYVKYIPKDAEYRIHVIGNAVIDRQRKVLRSEIPRENANWLVRNTANGFVFQRNGITVPEDVKAQALLAVQASGLDFAAADVIWSERRQQAYVLELNTAPGIEGTTVVNYANELLRYINEST